MAGWRRILSYLRPHRGVLLSAALASVAYAALDAFSIVVLIPFLGAVFGAGGGGGDGRIDRVLDFTVGRFVDLDGDPQTAVAGIIVFILVLVVLKNAVDFARSWLSARVEQGVTRDLRNEVYGHLLETRSRLLRTGAHRPDRVPPHPRCRAAPHPGHRRTHPGAFVGAGLHCDALLDAGRVGAADPGRLHRRAADDGDLGTAHPPSPARRPRGSRHGGRGELPHPGDRVGDPHGQVGRGGASRTRPLPEADHGLLRDLSADGPGFARWRARSPRSWWRWEPRPSSGTARAWWWKGRSAARRSSVSSS